MGRELRGRESRGGEGKREAGSGTDLRNDDINIDVCVYKISVKFSAQLALKANLEGLRDQE